MDNISSDEDNTRDFEVEGIHSQVFTIAEQFMARHYLLDTQSLYIECLRKMHDFDGIEIANAINDLLYRRILVNDTAFTRKNLLQNHNRASILALIKAIPGIHFSKILETLKINSTTLHWHLEMLEKFDFIREEHYGNKDAYFDFFLERNNDVLNYYFQKKKYRDIFRAIMDNEVISFSQLLNTLKIPRTTLLRRIKTLIESNLVTNIVISGKFALKIHDFCKQILDDLLAGID